MIIRQLKLLKSVFPKIYLMVMTALYHDVSKDVKN
jgi:hypothetical protein